MEMLRNIQMYYIVNNIAITQGMINKYARMYVHTKLTIHFSPIEEACKKLKQHFHNVIQKVSWYTYIPLLKGTNCWSKFLNSLKNLL